jgi:hypothetical protein
VFACPVASVAEAAFDRVEQAVVARLDDGRGGTMTLVHPFTNRGAAGCTALLTLLEGGAVRFVAGTFRLRGGELLVAPISVVYDTPAGRRLLQPWVDDRLAGVPAGSRPPAVAEHADPGPLESYVVILQQAVGELLVTGLDRADHVTARRWRDLTAHGESLGGDLLVRDAADLAGCLDAKRHQLRWDRTPAAAAAMRLAVLAEVARGM